MILRMTFGVLTLLLASSLYASEELIPLDEVSTTALSDKANLSDEEKYIAWASQLWESIDKQTGIIQIEAANAVLDIPDGFYYFNPEDTIKILVDIWGNPPGQTTLGMLMPSNTTPFDSESWSVTINYEEDGYIADDDASDINYGDLLGQMQNDTAAASQSRVEQGYEAIELIGWASKPYYDASQKKLHWAKELKFGSNEAHTLNYNIRVLGRKGVLLLNFIASMDQKSLIDSNIDTVLAIAEFDKGSKYTDFNPDIDKVAAYGIGALVAGKVIAKTGFLAIALVFLKKFGIFILIAIGALFKNIFRKR